MLYLYRLKVIKSVANYYDICQLVDKFKSLICRLLNFIDRLLHSTYLLLHFLMNRLYIIYLIYIKRVNNKIYE